MRSIGWMDPLDRSTTRGFKVDSCLFYRETDEKKLTERDARTEPGNDDDDDDDAVLGSAKNRIGRRGETKRRTRGERTRG